MLMLAIDYMLCEAGTEKPVERKSQSGAMALVVILVTLVTIIIGIVAYRKRGRIYRRFPKVWHRDVYGKYIDLPVG